MKTKIINSNLYLMNVNSYSFLTFSRVQIKEKELIMFFKAIYDFSKVYENIITCIEYSIHNIKSKQAQSKVFTIINQLKKGELLSSALNKSGLFPSIIINIIKTGEKNNSLFESLKLIVDYLKKQKEQNSKLTKSLFYPLFSIFVFFGITLLFTNQVIPSLIEIANEMNEKLIYRFNLINKILYIFQMFFLCFIIFNVFLLIIRKYNMNLFEKICVNIVFLRKLFILKNLFFFTYYVKTAFCNNLTFEEAIDNSIDSFGDIWQNILRNIKKDINKGIEISSAMSRNSLFPNDFINIIKNGERTNNLANSFVNAHDFINIEYNESIDFLSETLPLVLIVLIAILVTCFVSFIMYPLYSFEV